MSGSREEKQQTGPAAVTLQLAGAMLCLSCNAIYQGQVCPKCGDPYGWLIGRWLAVKEAA